MRKLQEQRKREPEDRQHTSAAQVPAFESIELLTEILSVVAEPAKTHLAIEIPPCDEQRHEEGAKPQTPRARIVHRLYQLDLSSARHDRDERVQKSKLRLWPQTVSNEIRDLAKPHSDDDEEDGDYCEESDPILAARTEVQTLEIFRLHQLGECSRLNNRRRRHDDVLQQRLWRVARS